MKLVTRDVFSIAVNVTGRPSAGLWHQTSTRTGAPTLGILFDYFPSKDIVYDFSDVYNEHISQGLDTGEAKALMQVNMYRLLRQAACGLEHLHNNGVAHMDCHAGNILVGREEDGTVRAKVIDFGLSEGGGQQFAPCDPTRHSLMSPEEQAACKARVIRINVEQRQDSVL